MKKPNKSDLLQTYIKSAQMHGEATYKGDYKVANSQAKQLKKIYQVMEQNNCLADEMLNELLADESISVRSWAAAHALGLRIRISEAEDTLEKVAAQPEIGILGFNAKMALKVWKEQGYIKF